MDLIAQTAVYTVDTGTSYAFGGFMFVWMFIIWFIAIVAFWKVFEKAGQEGWKSIIPFYNMWILFEIAGRPGWWMFGLFIPFVNFVLLIVLSLDIAKAFGKSTAFAIFGLLIFSFFGYMIIGWGDATYTKPSTEVATE